MNRCVTSICIRPEHRSQSIVLYCSTSDFKKDRYYNFIETREVLTATMIAVVELFMVVLRHSYDSAMFLTRDPILHLKGRVLYYGVSPIIFVGTCAVPCANRDAPRV